MDSAPKREPIFILSCYRTGSTLLRYIFDTHPEVYAPPELNLGQAAFDLAHLDCSLIGLHPPSKPEQLPAEVVAGLRATLGGRLDAATARKGKIIWCEKSPSNLAVLGLLRLLFPEARFVCLYRHAFDVSKSLIKMIYRTPDLQSFLIKHKNNLEAAALDYWNQRTATALSLESELPERCVRVRYEDLVDRPAEVVPPVFTSLGLSWDEKLLEAVFTSQHDDGMQDHYITQTRSIHADSVGGGQDLPLDNVPTKVLDTTHGLLATLGYPERPEPIRPGQPTADSPVEISPAAAAVPTPRWLFEIYLAERLRTQSRLVEAIGSSYRFTVDGEGGGTWVIDPREGRILSGQMPATCSVEVSATDLFAIAHGRLHPWKAAEQGRLRFQGDIKVRELEALVRFLLLSPA